ncbi:MAG: FmdB family zinc ribbon protein [Anaerolineales bacterium]
MPIYAYRCESCGVQFDRHQKFSDDTLVECPECGEPALHKLIQPVGIVFKGSGFYVTDNRSASNGGRETSVTSSSDKNGKKDSAAAESSKPEAKKSESSAAEKEPAKD